MAFVEDDVEYNHDENRGVEPNQWLYGAEFSFISRHHEAEENQDFGEDFHEDLGDEEDNVKSWEGLVFVLIPWSHLFYTRDEGWPFYLML